MSKTPSDSFIVAIDLGGTSLRVAAIDFQGRIIKRLATPTRAEEGPDAVIKRITDKVAELLGAERFRRVAAVALGVPGPLDPSTGIVFSPPNMPGWERVPLKQIFEDEFPVPVCLGNDANAAALGEQMFGAGKGTRHMIYLTVSTGIGGGVIADGKLLLGAGGSAGEVGHMTIDLNGPRCGCGNIGCLEALASGTAIARQARAQLEKGSKSSMLDAVGGDLSRLTGEIVVREAEKRDPLASEIVHDAAVALGVGVVNLAHLFDPEMVVIGGGISNAGPLLFDPVRAIAQERAMDIVKRHLRIERTALGDDVGLLGAAALAIASITHSQ
ncbi:MAG: ROK family protein [Chloroflexi bacterium]|nr:ROK family protein [Chloroflexota bacterium]